MFTSRTAKRFRAIAIALAITFATNYGISFAARNNASATTIETSVVLDRSGATPIDPLTPKPRSGATPIDPLTPKPRSGATPIDPTTPKP